ncbi:Fic/DOC family protein [Pontibacillus litoralis]|uniref:protein adenylyltransferase n=1 Tax=Pontibacillus litoralis JSM 072002 TaxID=1385512 RepID=A0A0A5FZI2_9BACI|nr:Fic family protein [Pontibacillus litoralis]KGX85204.1 hypothetical protein N784_09920 [Pontibacillus litoralis JSM 072002]
MDKQSKYCYPGTNVLINKFNEQNHEKLMKLERIITAERLYELYRSPIPGSFGMKHLQKIHKYIFKDVYPFSGELREEQIFKGSTPFAHPMFLSNYASDVFRQLKTDKYLKGMEYDDFVKKMSYYFTEVNMLHPFREGNGRTQREFFRVLALKNGYELDWSNVEPKTMMKLSIQSVADSNAFNNLFDNAIVNKQPDQTLINEYRSLKTKVNELEL